MKGDEWAIRLSAKCLQRAYMLLSSIMKVSEFPASAIFECGDVHNLLYVGLVYELWRFEVALQALYGFGILVTGTRCPSTELLADPSFSACLK